MDAQVMQFVAKRRTEPMEGAPPKRQCLAVAQRRSATAFNQALNETLDSQGVEACLSMEPEGCIYGPCNCDRCSSKTSVTVPQVRFEKKQRDGFIQTCALFKEYRLVLNKPDFLSQKASYTEEFPSIIKTM